MAFTDLSVMIWNVQVTFFVTRVTTHSSQLTGRWFKVHTHDGRSKSQFWNFDATLSFRCFHFKL